MGAIQVLPEHVANKIAAGEVVDRPASIVKELIENSLDAQTTSIEISIKHGGKSLIRIADNGGGMNAEDAELAFLRHATSKIKTAEELDCIASFGFRGEALSSIAAVSRMSLLTRKRGESVGTEVSYDGGKQSSAKQSPCGEGTVIEVRDLFFNTPARRKFVKTDSTESGHVRDAVTNLALANPEVRFHFRSNDKTVFDLVPAKTIMERARAIWGEDQAKHLVDIYGEGQDIKVRGVVGKPFLARGNRSDQVFFINQRWIKSIGFSYALQDGFHGLLMHGQYAVAAVFVEVDPQRVDVNVHPTKQEVRLSKENEIKSLIRRTVYEALEKESDIAPSLKMPKAQPVDYLQGSNTVRGTDFLNLQPPQGSFGGGSRIAEMDSIAETPMEPILFRDKLCITKVLGQIHHTFIVAETEEGMIVIDQHAAHERVMFEETLREFESQSTKKQALLMDEILELHPKYKEVLQYTEPFLSKLGFELEEFGENSWILRSYPAFLKDENPIEYLKRFVEQKEAGKMHGNADNAQEDIAAMIACKRKSVKAHDPLTHQGMESLLKQLSLCDNPFNCPHGRPTFFKHTFDNLERQFKRK